MLCKVCREREATHYSHGLLGGKPGEEPSVCYGCWEIEQRQDAADSERRIREMVVDWDMIRPLIAASESRSNADELRKLADLLQFAAERYGRTLPPDVAAFLERHRRAAEIRMDQERKSRLGSNER